MSQILKKTADSKQQELAEFIAASVKESVAVYLEQLMAKVITIEGSLNTLTALSAATEHTVKKLEAANEAPVKRASKSAQPKQDAQKTEEVNLQEKINTAKSAKMWFQYKFAVDAANAANGADAADGADFRHVYATADIIESVYKLNQVVTKDGSAKYLAAANLVYQKLDASAKERVAADFTAFKQQHTAAAAPPASGKTEATSVKPQKKSSKAPTETSTKRPDKQLPATISGGPKPPTRRASSTPSASLASSAQLSSQNAPQEAPRNAKSLSSVDNNDTTLPAFGEYVGEGSEDVEDDS